jgi:hypothetical protein
VRQLIVDLHLAFTESVLTLAGFDLILDDSYESNIGSDRLFGINISPLIDVVIQYLGYMSPEDITIIENHRLLF